MKRKANSIVVHTLMVTLAFACSAGWAGVDDIAWTGAADDSDWFNPLNWEGGAVPGPQDSSIVEDSVVSAEFPVVFEGRMSFRADGSDLSFTDLAVGTKQLASVDAFYGSRLTSRNCILGKFSGSAGYVWWQGIEDAEELYGVGFSSSQQMTVGAGGNGQFYSIDAPVEAMSCVAGLFYGSNGELDLERDTQFECVDLALGVYGQGKMSLSRNAHLTCETAMVGYVGDTPKYSTILMDGTCSAVVNDVLIVGYSDEARVFVSGELTVGSALVGGRLDEQMDAGDGLIEVTDGGQFTCLQNAFIGEMGCGRLSIQGQGRVQTGDCYLGLEDSEGCSGIAMLCDGGFWQSSNLIAGVNGYGSLVVGAGCEVNVDGRLCLAQETGSYGVCVMTGGTVKAGAVDLGGDYSLPCEADGSWWDRQGAKLLFDGDDCVIETADRFRIGPVGSIEAGEAGTLVLDGAAFENRSNIPARSEGLAAMEVIARSPAQAVVVIEAGSVDTGCGVDDLAGRFAFDTLRLDPDARVRLVDDFNNMGLAAPAEAVYVEHLVLSAGSSLDLDGLNLYYRTLTDEGGSVTGGAITALRIPGDANCDGRVDLEDFVILRTNFNEPPSWHTGDFDGDGDIDLDDFVILKTNFGREAD